MPTPIEDSEIFNKIVKGDGNALVAMMLDSQVNDNVKRAIELKVQIDLALAVRGQVP